MITIAFCVVLILSMGIHGAIAYLTDKSEIDNSFQVATVEAEIMETFENNTKTNIYVQNSGIAKIYTRVEVLIYYKDADGNVLMEQPIEGVDYSITYPTDFDDNWIVIDGYYYYKKVLAGGADTEQLVTAVYDLQPNDERQLVVDILSQSIQADPVEAVETAWSVQVQEDGTIKALVQ